MHDPLGEILKLIFKIKKKMCLLKHPYPQFAHYFLTSTNAIHSNPVCLFFKLKCHVPSLVGELLPNIQPKMQMMVTSNFIKHSARHGLKCFMHINSFN